MGTEITIDGVTIRMDADFAAIVRRQLEISSVWIRKDDRWPQDGMSRALLLAAGTPVEAPLIAATIQLLTDGDVTVRGRAIALLERHAGRFSPAVMLDLLEHHRDLFESVRVEGVTDDLPDLRWVILRAMAGHGSTDPQLLAHLRDAARDPDHGSWVLAGLTRSDPDWVIEHAHPLVVGRPTRVQIVLHNLQTTPLRERFVRALSSAPIDVRRNLAIAIDRHVREPNEAQRLRKLLG